MVLSTPTLIDRLATLIAGRNVGSWATAMGMVKSSQQALRNALAGTGKWTPDVDTIVRIAQAERVRFDWLLDGRGEPYVVGKHDAQEMVTAVTSAIEGGANRALILRAGDVPVAVALSTVLRRSVPRRVGPSDWHYLHVELHVGPISPEVLAACAALSQCVSAEVDDAAFAALRDGRAGNTVLMGLWG